MTARRWWRPAVLPYPRFLSVRLRLTLLYSVLLAVTLLSFTLVLSSAMTRVTYGMVDRSVREATQQLLMNKELRIDRVIVPASRFAAPETYVQSRTLDGTVTSGTDNLADRTLPLGDDALAIVRRGQEWTEVVSVDNSRLLVHSTLVSVQGRPVGILQVARSLAAPDEAVRAIHLIALGGAATALVVAFGLGWLLAGAALAPVAAITTTARHIGDHRDFQRRLGETGDDEIGRLAAALNDMLAALATAYAQADQALQAQKRLVADASHELRTPLTTIRGNLGLLQRTPPITAEDHDAVVSDIAGETDRLMRLVGDLLMLARSDAGAVLNFTDVDVRPLVLELGRRAAATWPGHAIAADSGDVRVRANRDALVQILLILLDNAAKYTAPGGRISIWTTADDRAVQIHLRDTGRGIAPEHLPYIFERFYRGDSARSGSGAGLGLAIAQSLTIGLHGTIDVSSTPGAGTTVTLALARVP